LFTQGGGEPTQDILSFLPDANQAWNHMVPESGVIQSTQNQVQDQLSRLADLPQSVQAQIARLTPSMRQAILKKGFPIMSLIGLMNSQPTPQPEQ